MHAVEADVADFALQAADTVYAGAQIVAQGFNLAGGEAYVEQLVGDVVAQVQIGFVLAVVFLQRGNHFLIGGLDVFEVGQNFLFKLFEVGSRDGAGIFFVSVFFVGIFVFAFL